MRHRRLLPHLLLDETFAYMCCRTATPRYASGFGVHPRLCGGASATRLVSAVGICPSPCPKAQPRHVPTLPAGAYKAPAARVLLIVLLGGGWSCLGRGGSDAYKVKPLSEGTTGGEEGLLHGQNTHAIDVSMNGLRHICIASGRCTVAADPPLALVAEEC
jgi:hypothetical protein